MRQSPAHRFGCICLNRRNRFSETWLTNAVASPAGRRAQWNGLRYVEGSGIAALIASTPITFRWYRGGDSHRFDQRVGGSIREKLLLTLVGRRCFARAWGRAGITWAWSRAQPAAGRPPTAGRPSAAPPTLGGRRFIYGALLVPSCLRARRTQLFSSMPNRIHSRICIANATSRSCRLSISESTAQRRPFSLASLRLRLCRSRLPFRARRHHAREAWRHWLGCRWRGRRG